MVKTELLVAAGFERQPIELLCHGSEVLDLVGANPGEVVTFSSGLEAVVNFAVGVSHLHPIS